MAVSVEAREDLIDRDTNSVVVPKGSIGTIVDTEYPPSELRHKVDFTVGNGTVTKWVLPDNIIYRDGPVGMVQAVMEADQQLVTSVSYPDVMSSSDLILGDRFSAVRTKVRFKFSGGLILDVISDRNTGEQRFELGYESS